MNPYGDGISNHELEVIIITHFRRTVALLEESAPIVLPIALKDNAEEIMAFLIAYIEELESGLNPVSVLQWKAVDGGDDQFYLMDPDKVANNNYRLNAIFA